MRRRLAHDDAGKGCVRRVPWKESDEFAGVAKTTALLSVDSGNYGKPRDR